MAATPKVIEQAMDDVLWWEAANMEHPSAFREQLSAARKRLGYLQRAANLPAGQSGLVPQDTIDRIFELVSMPDIIPDVLRSLTGLVLELRPGAKEGKLTTCPFCGNCKRNFGVALTHGSEHKPGDWYCWACTEGGSFKWLLMRQSGLPFRELLRELAGWTGIALDSPDQTPPEVLLL